MSGIPFPYKIINRRKLQYVANNVAPHSETERARYTCPDNRFACIDAIMIYVSRNTTPSTGGVFVGKVQFMIGGTDAVLIAFAHSRATTAGSYDKIHLPCKIWLRPGDAVRFTTADTSTGGTVDYDIEMIILETE